SAGTYGVGRYVVSGASRSIRPSSASLSTAYAKTGLLSEAASKIVSSVAGVFVTALATPKAPLHATRPPRTTAIESPGTPARAISDCTPPGEGAGRPSATGPADVSATPIRAAVARDVRTSDIGK